MPENSPNNQQQLIVFIKAPIPGKCKTRLSPFLSPQQASEFYKTLVMTCMSNIQSCMDTNISIYTTPDTMHPFIQNLIKKYDVSLHLQIGENLGERMTHAIQHSLKSYDKCVLIGSDCPYIDADYITRAFKTLQQYDMVFGPANDGGYVLVGANKLNNAIFSHTDWGMGSVLQQSLNNCSAAKYSTHLLNSLTDIDTPQDYQAYISHASP